MALAVSSGLTAIATTSDTPVDLITAAQLKDLAPRNPVCVVIINEGAVAGFISLDGGTSWPYRLPATAAITIDRLVDVSGIQVKRVASGSNVTGVWASVTAQN